MHIKYQIVIQWSDLDDCYVASIPELQGCMTDGKTLAEVANNIQMAYDEWIDTAKQLGRDIPPHSQVEPDKWDIDLIRNAESRKDEPTVTLDDALMGCGLIDDKTDGAFCEQLYKNPLNSNDEDKW